MDRIISSFNYLLFMSRDMKTIFKHDLVCVWDPFLVRDRVKEKKRKYIKWKIIIIRFKVLEMYKHSIYTYHIYKVTRRVCTNIGYIW